MCDILVLPANQIDSPQWIPIKSPPIPTESAPNQHNPKKFTTNPIKPPLIPTKSPSISINSLPTQIKSPLIQKQSPPTPKSHHQSQQSHHLTIKERRYHFVLRCIMVSSWPRRTRNAGAEDARGTRSRPPSAGWRSARERSTWSRSQRCWRRKT